MKILKLILLATLPALATSIQSSVGGMPNPLTMQGDIFVGTTNGAPYLLPGGASGLFLGANGTGATPSYQTVPYGSLSGAVPTWNQNTTGTAANITGITNATLSTLSALSLPISQVTGISGTAPISYSAGVISHLSTDGYHHIPATSTTSSGKLLIPGSAAGSEAWTAMSGDATISSTGALTLASVVTAGGPIGSASTTPVVTIDAKGRVTALTSATITPAGFTGSLAGDVTGTQYYTSVGAILGRAIPAWANGMLRYNGGVVSWDNSVFTASTPNLVWATNSGTITGNNSFRALTALDIPSLSYQPLENQRLSTSNSPAFAGISVGTVTASGTISASTFSGGVFSGNSFTKSGGTSSQFLKADGSTDGNTYATSGSLGSYLPLAAGSGSPLTGTLYGTNATFSGAINVPYLPAQYEAQNQSSSGTYYTKILTVSCNPSSYDWWSSTIIVNKAYASNGAAQVELSVQNNNGTLGGVALYITGGGGFTPDQFIYSQSSTSVDLYIKEYGNQALLDWSFINNRSGGGFTTSRYANTAWTTTAPSITGTASPNGIFLPITGGTLTGGLTGTSATFSGAVTAGKAQGASGAFTTIGTNPAWFGRSGDNISAWRGFAVDNYYTYVSDNSQIRFLINSNTIGYFNPAGLLLNGALSATSVSTGAMILNSFQRLPSQTSGFYTGFSSPSTFVSLAATGGSTVPDLPAGSTDGQTMTVANNGNVVTTIGASAGHAAVSTTLAIGQSRTYRWNSSISLWE